MHNGRYSEECQEIVERAKQIEKRWMAIAENAQVVATFEWPSPIRPHAALWCDTPPNKPPYNNIPSAQEKCPRCGGPGRPAGGFKSEEVREGCRMNGDAWGATYSYCQQCGWCVWSKWDEA